MSMRVQRPYKRALIALKSATGVSNNEWSLQHTQHAACAWTSGAAHAEPSSSMRADMTVPEFTLESYY